MLDLSFIREHPEKVKWAIEVKGTGNPELVDRILELDRERRRIQTELDQARNRLHTISRRIGELMRTGQREEAEQVKAEVAGLKSQIRALEESLRQIRAELHALLLELPNIPHPSVPVGHTPEDNVVVFTWGEQPTFSFTPQPHWELATRHELVDFERGAKVTGAGFPFYKGQGARLQRGLIAFFLDQAIARGYIEIQPPHLVNEASAIGTGQLPDKEGQMYEVPRDGLYLIPTAEVPVTNYHREEILAEQDLPRYYCAYTPCFRREAGSYGKDVRGLNRLHQFDKVELVKIVHPETSYDELEKLREDAEQLLQQLGLPYRRVLMCTGDMGFTQSKKYDLEVWSPGQQRWLEVSSISNFEAFQARRANIRFRPAEGGKPSFVHTLNGSGLALPRVVAALLETYQQTDGSILIPEVLQPYVGFTRIG